MWTSIVNGTFRAWFAVDDGRGVPKVGLIPTSFTVSVIAPDDSDSTTATVTASTQVSGVYYFDIPGAFLIANGAGNYGVAIVVDAVAPIFKATSGQVLKVSIDDIDKVSKTVKPLLSLL